MVQLGVEEQKSTLNCVLDVYHRLMSSVDLVAHERKKADDYRIKTRLEGRILEPVLCVL